MYLGIYMLYACLCTCLLRIHTQPCYWLELGTRSYGSLTSAGRPRAATSSQPVYWSRRYRGGSGQAAHPVCCLAPNQSRQQSHIAILLPFSHNCFKKQILDLGAAEHRTVFHPGYSITALGMSMPCSLIWQEIRGYV